MIAQGMLVHQMIRVCAHIPLKILFLFKCPCNFDENSFDFPRHICQGNTEIRMTVKKMITLDAK